MGRRNRRKRIANETCLWRRLRPAVTNRIGKMRCASVCPSPTSLHAGAGERRPVGTTVMIDKIVQSMAEAMAGIRDGTVVLLGGFGSIGQPTALIDGLIEQGATDLTVVANNAGTGRTGLARLMELGRVRKIVCSYPAQRRLGGVRGALSRRQDRARDRAAGHPLGTHARGRRRHPAFYTATAVGTQLAAGKEAREIAGRKYLLEEALARRRRADRGLGGGPLG